MTELEIRFSYRGWDFRIDVEQRRVVPLDVSDNYNTLYKEAIPLPEKSVREFETLCQQLYDHRDDRVFVPNISRVEFIDKYGDKHVMDSENIYINFVQRIPLSEEGLKKLRYSGTN